MDALRIASNIDLRLLAIYMTVVEAGGFSSAQITLNVSASVVSRNIASLEGRLGMRLCQRGRVGFRLTDKGRLIYELCQRLFSSLEEFRSEAASLKGQLVGELSIAIVDNWVTDTKSPLAKTIRDFKAIGPDISLTLFSLAPDDLEHTIMDGRARVGVGVFHQHRPGLAYEPLYSTPWICIADTHIRYTRR
ncbi:MAG: LysR family transcriptional regulator [Rhodospirillales bacterium]|nr:LysR family transcriptional regulator [Rhodospirillales bacterium]